jgi:hypothetical protein
MMKLKSYLLILSLLLLSSCSVFRTPEKEVVTVTEIVRPQITVAEKPKSLKLTDVKWYIVNRDNIDEFQETWEKENGDLVFYVISVRDYEKLALNMAKIREYLLKQNEIIVYYEEAVTEIVEEDLDEEVLQ